MKNPVSFPGEADVYDLNNLQTAALAQGLNPEVEVQSPTSRAVVRVELLIQQKALAEEIQKAYPPEHPAWQE